MQKITQVIKADGSIQDFDPQKLLNSLIRAGASDKDASLVLNHITNLIEGKSFHTNSIYKEAFLYLHKISHPVALRYSIRRAITDLGPEGFAFEKFFSEILRAKGYETVVDQKILGRCVEHEIDVVAWKGDELILIESKFHNEYNYKTDLKVVLYVKERFDDLKDTVLDYGSSKRKMTGGWLVTNTKFSLNAIQYGECNNLKMVGWNYPSGNDLQKMIEDSGVKPITVLNSLGSINIKELISHGIVSCGNKEKILTKLKEIGNKDDEIKKVEQEIDLINS